MMRPTPVSLGHFLAVLSLACGCDRPPPPDPPMLALIEITPVPTTMGDFALVLGNTGAAPSRVLLVSRNLDLDLAPISGTVARDGSFLLEPRADVGHVLRLHTERDGRVSAPADFVVAFGSAVAPELTECLEVPASIELDGDGVIPIVNGCADDVVLDEVRLRADAAIELSIETPISVPASGSIELALHNDGPGEVVLLVFGAELGGERRAVSIVGSR
jgi:hypothetical protein